ncbi:MAG: FliH/SctL family protein [Planctomycetota bacterium]|jgi:flagellar assembly protein FliH
MALIKRERADEVAQRAVVLDLADLRREGELIIAAAHREAERVMEAAREQSAELVGSADDRGFALGLDRGIAEGSAQGRREGCDEAKVDFAERLDGLHAAWSDAVSSWEQQREAMLLAAREEVLDFALQLARKIVLRIPAIDPTVVQDQVAEAMTRLLRPSAVTIRINREDRGLVEEVLPGLQQRISSCEHVYLEDDDSVARGGCVVATEHGGIDATLDRQLDRIAEALIGEGTDCSPGSRSVAPPESSTEDTGATDDERSESSVPEPDTDADEPAS